VNSAAEIRLPGPLAKFKILPIAPEHLAILSRCKSAFYAAVVIAQTGKEPKWFHEIENQKAEPQVRLLTFLLSAPPPALRELFCLHPIEIMAHALNAVPEIEHETDLTTAFQILGTAIVAFAASKTGSPSHLAQN